LKVIVNNEPSDEALSNFAKVLVEAVNEQLSKEAQRKVLNENKKIS
jgi:hypothetical protein